MGKDGDRINPIFLNLMSTLTSRGGAVYIRIGGNTQDKATILADGLEDGQTIEKAAEDTSTVSIYLFHINQIAIKPEFCFSRLLPPGFLYLPISSMPWRTYQKNSLLNGSLEFRLMTLKTHDFLWGNWQKKS